MMVKTLVNLPIEVLNYHKFTYFFYSQETRRPPSAEFIPMIVGTKDSCLK